ncbi:MAG TPA: tetratricopeptide repeat protein, partial [Saprospiraceae bacterium]|nr:tetratricopeptide repeat protein [Saprospiraceae bacterium]
MPAYLRHCICLLTFCFLSASGTSSPVTTLVDSLLTLPRDDQQWALWLSTYPAPDKEDSTIAIMRYRALEKEFNQRNRPDLAQQAWLIRMMYTAVYLNVYNEKGLAYIDQAIREAHERNWPIMEAGCTLVKGDIYYVQTKYGPAFEFLQKGYTALKALGLENCPNINSFLQTIGQCYYEFGDYEGAIQILKEGLSIRSAIMTRHGELRQLKNTLALAYQKTEQYDSAIVYFKQAHEESVKNGYTFWAGLTNGNLGNVYYLQGKYDEAIPLMEEDFKQSQVAGEWSSAVNAAMTLATMYMKKGNMKVAADYLQYAEKNINYGNVRELAGFYKNLSVISKLQGDYAKAFAYIDSFQVYTDSVRKINNTRVLNQAKLKVEVEHHAGEIKLLEASKNRELLIRNSLLAILILTGIIAGLWVNRQRLKRQKELEVAALQKARAEDELNNARKELLSFTEMLKEKNDLLDSFRNEIESLHQSGQLQVQERTDQLNQLLNATILTEEDWKEFRNLFDKVYPGFFFRLKEKMSDLSPADTRMIALTKLQLAPKEMAAMLGLTYEAIK